ncbi:MAG: NADH-ubiquinone oxidoreductase-F iron-sulfur binding region domain-containing protein [Vicinamibacterales bacterium]
MDLHITGAEPTDAERAAVDRLLGAPASGWDGGVRLPERDGRVARARGGATHGRDQLLPAFHAVQDGIGWVSHGALNYICRRLGVPPAEAWGVLTFYHLLSTEPRPARTAHVCDDIACRLRGADQLVASLEAGGASVHRSPCLGQCDRAPAALVLEAGAPARREEVVRAASAAAVQAALTGTAHAPGDGLDALRAAVPQHGTPGLKLLARVGVADPTRLDDYRAHGGYAALTRAIGMGPAAVIAEVTASNLLGRGGAAFPTGRKWAAVAAEPARPKYVVCNADESEPGTFKDRVLLTGDPFAIVEAMTICGFATGAERGVLYVRGEYPVAEARVSAAIAEARRAGLLGADVSGAGFAFDIEVRRGAGAYICGEETALFNSVEGRRGEPRSKPPFPAQVGLFGKPTVVNNVETLAHVLHVITEGGAAWASTGTPSSAGTRLFCLSGHVERPGVYELPMGETLGDLLALAGGVTGGRALGAILLGGAAGMFVGPGQLGLRLTFEDARRAGVTLGSGVVMVFDDTTDFAGTLARIAQFFQDESCGQCVPCRVGTVRQRELLERLRAGTPAGRDGDLALLNELGQAMRDASICGLGQTASSAIESAVRLGVVNTGGK